MHPDEEWKTCARESVEVIDRCTRVGQKSTIRYDRTFCICSHRLDYQPRKVVGVGSLPIYHGKEGSQSFEISLNGGRIRGVLILTN